MDFKNFNKRFIFTLILLCIFWTASGQNITKNFVNTPLNDVIEEIKKEVDYSFIYEKDELKSSKNVTIKLSDHKFEEVLELILEPRGFDYEIKDKLIVITKSQSSQDEIKNVPFLINGKIIDAKTEEPVIGASVMIKGSLEGVIADTDGEFSIKVKTGTELQVSCIGYTDYFFNATEKSNKINILLQPSVEFLEDAVVVGYGTVKKANLTGAVDQVSSDVFENRPTANTTQMLQGSVPNLNISLADGKPNRSASYNIRGTTSIGGGGSALVLIDGVEGDPAMLNPNDIESVSVLKDAASSAIYGSRAPFGVVLITTKNPSNDETKFKINYTGNVSFQTPTAVPSVVDDGYVYASLFYDSWYNYRFNDPTGINNTQDFSLNWLNEFKKRKLAGNTLETAIEPDGKYVYYGNENYYDAIYKDLTVAQTHNISVSGKSDKIGYYFSGRLYNYDGLFNFNPDTYNTFNFRSKVDAQILPWLKLTNNLEFTNDVYSQPTGSDKEGSGVIWRSINDQGHPSSPIFNPDGTMTKSGAYAIGGLVTGNNWIKTNTKTLKNINT